MDGAGLAFAMLAVFAAVVLGVAIFAGISAARGGPQRRTASDEERARVAELLSRPGHVPAVYYEETAGARAARDERDAENEARRQRALENARRAEEIARTRPRPPRRVENVGRPEDGDRPSRVSSPGSDYSWMPERHIPPEGNAIGVRVLTPQEAEEYVADWMRRHGFDDATATQASRDGGIDVTSSRVLAQVKHYTGAVAPKDVRELAGVVSADRSRRVGALFTSGTYSKVAQDFASNAGIALFRYDADGSNVSAVNHHARQLM